MIIIRFVFLIGFFASFPNDSFGQSWKTYSDSAKFFSDQKKSDTAIIFHKKARVILLKDSAVSESLNYTINRIADLYLSLNEYDSALIYYLEAREIIEKLYGKENATYAVNSNFLGRVYLEKGQYKKAEYYFVEFREIRALVFSKESIQYASSCNNLANLYSTIGEFNKAEPLYLEALIIREKKLGKDDPDYAQSCNNLSDMYRNTSQYDKAEPLALLAKDIRMKRMGKEDQTYAISCTNLANLYRDMGQFSKAEQLYIEAKQIREKLFSKESTIYAASCNILADLYGYTGQFDKAEMLYKEALQIREKKLGKDHRDYAQSCNNLAEVYLNLAFYEKAAIFAEQAKAIWEQTLDSDDPALAVNNNILGKVYGVLGKFKQAENCFLQARELLQKKFAESHPYFISNSLGLANTYWNLQQITKASSFYTQAFNAQYSQLNKIFEFTNENEKQLFLKNVNGSPDEFQSFNFKAYPHSNAGEAYTVSLLSRNLILSATRQQRQLIYQSGDTALKKEFDIWVNLKQQLASLSVHANESHQYNSHAIEARENQVKFLQEKVDSIEKNLVRSSAIFNKSQQKISWKKIQASLTSSEASIEFISFRYYNGSHWTDSVFFAAIILRKDQRGPQLVPLFEKRQLDSLLKVQNISNTFSRGVRMDINAQSLNGIYKLVWKPVEKYMANIKKIYFAPTSDLYKIPFAALSIDSTRFLGDKYELVQLNSTASIIDRHQEFLNKADKLKLYGGIKYDADSLTMVNATSVYYNTSVGSGSLPEIAERDTGFQYLPGTEDEVRGIEKSAMLAGFNVSLLLGIDATEESFKSMAGKASPSVLHVATHGFFFPDQKNDKTDSTPQLFETNGAGFKQSGNPLFRSGLLFAGANNTWRGKPIAGIDDGILTAYEVSDMYLANTKLVVLSACETALGDIMGSEGVYGLQRAFKMAGVQNLVMSLWQVPDKETSEFMKVFYRNIFNKESISKAFYLTQIYMKRIYRHEPYKWAAFILVR